MTKKQGSSKLGAIKFLQVGRTLVATIDGKKYTLTPDTKEKRDEIKKLIESYNKLPSQTKLDKIVRLFIPKTVAKETAKKAETKKIKNTLKTTKKKLKEVGKEGKATKQLAAVIESVADSAVTKPEELKQVVQEVEKKTENVPATVGQKRPGEYYGGNRF